MKRNRHYDELLSVFKKILLQRCNSAHKIYSIHEPDVQCISKGKEPRSMNLETKSPSYTLPRCHSWCQFFPQRIR